MENENLYQEDSKAKYDCLLFDLDDTLYPLNSGLSAHVRKNIQEYMLVKLAIEESRVPELNVSLYKTYGTTMAALKALLRKTCPIQIVHIEDISARKAIYAELELSESMKSVLDHMGISKLYSHQVLLELVELLSFS